MTANAIPANTVVITDILRICENTTRISQKSQAPTQVRVRIEGYFYLELGIYTRRLLLHGIARRAS